MAGRKARSDDPFLSLSEWLTEVVTVLYFANAGPNIDLPVVDVSGIPNLFM